MKNTSPTSIPTAQQQAENLRGVHTTQLDSSTTSSNNSTKDNRAPSQKLQDNEQEQSSEEAVVVIREESYIHVEYKSSESNVNVQNALKIFAIQLRRGDANIQIIPYDEDKYLPSYIMTNEKDFPKEEQNLGKWIKSVEIRRKRFCFSLRVSSTNLSALKTIIFAWCKKTSSWTTFVDFRAHQLCSPGWFYGICPYYYNRNDFQKKSYIIGKKNMEKQLQLQL